MARQKTASAITLSIDAIDAIDERSNTTARIIATTAVSNRPFGSRVRGPGELADRRHLLARARDRVKRPELVAPAEAKRAVNVIIQ